MSVSLKLFIIFIPVFFALILTYNIDWLVIIYRNRPEETLFFYSGRVPTTTEILFSGFHLANCLISAILAFGYTFIAIRIFTLIKSIPGITRLLVSTCLLTILFGAFYIIYMQVLCHLGVGNHQTHEFVTSLRDLPFVLISYIFVASVISLLHFKLNK